MAPTLGVPEHPAPVAILDSQGDFVTAWQSLQDNGSYAVYVQAFKPNGDAIGEAPQIVSTGVGNQMNPSIASDGNGDFVVAWQSEDLSNLGDDIYYQEGTLDAASTTAPLTFSLETPSIVNTSFTASGVDTHGDQTNPSVAMDATGHFVIAWQSKDLSESNLGSEIYARQGTFGDGLESTGDFLVSSTTTGEPQGGDQTAPTVAMAKNTITDSNDTSVPSDFLIAWQGPATSTVGSEGEEASQSIFAKLYSPDGTANSGEVEVTSGQGHDQVAPSAAMSMSSATDGKVVLVWQADGVQGSGSDIFEQPFTFTTTNGAPTLTKVTDPQLVNQQTTAEPQRAPAVGMDANGNYLVTWQSSHQDGYSWGIYGQAYDASGAPQAGEFLVNNVIQQGPQTASAVSTLPDGQTVVTWYGPQVNGHGEEGSGGHPLGVHARVFTLEGKDAQSKPIPGATPGANPDEFLLSLVTSPEDQPPAAATNATNGDYVVVWQSWEDTGDMSGFGVYAQRYDANGTPNGGPVLVNTTFAGSQSRPSVAMDAAGDFVVVWQYQDPNGEQTGISGRYFNAKTGTWGNEFSIVTDSTSTPTNPSVAMDANGDFVVVWQIKETAASESSTTWNILGERFTKPTLKANGVPAGNEVFTVNTTTTTDQVSPVVAMNASGQFAVAWVGYNLVETTAAAESGGPGGGGEDGGGGEEAGSEKSIYAQWYNANGTPVKSAQIPVSTYNAGAQEYPAIAIDDKGDFVVAWQSINQEVGSGVSWGVYARQFLRNADGTFQEPPEFPVNETTSGPQRFAAVGMNQSTGDFVIAWQSMKEDAASWGIFSQQYNADGTLDGVKTQVNTWGKGPQVLPAIAENARGNFGIFWVGQGLGSEGTPVDGINGRLYEFSTNGGGGTPPAPTGTSPSTIIPQSLLTQMSTDLQLLPFITPQTHSEVAELSQFHLDS